MYHPPPARRSAPASPSITFLRRGSAVEAIAAASAEVGGTSWLSPWRTSWGSRSAMMDSPKKGVSGSIEPAAKGADQLDIESEGTGFELSDGKARVHHALLRGQHGQIVGEAFLVAASGNAQGIVIVGQG